MPFTTADVGWMMTADVGGMMTADVGGMMTADVGGMMTAVAPSAGHGSPAKQKAGMTVVNEAAYRGGRDMPQVCAG